MSKQETVVTETEETEEETLLTEEKETTEEKTEEETETSQEEKGVEEKLKEEKKEGAPEDYEDFQLPEGMEVDSEMLEAFVPVAKELNLTQEQAQKLVDLQTQHMTKAAEASQAAWESLQDEWKNSAQSDKEIGGHNFSTSIANAKLFIKTFGGEALVDALNATGVGNHPEIIRAFAKAGKAIAEDGAHFGTESSTPKSLEEILYPKQGQ